MGRCQAGQRILAEYDAKHGWKSSDYRRARVPYANCVCELKVAMS
jgi:hypothetical protein